MEAAGLALVRCGAWLGALLLVGVASLRLPLFRRRFLLLSLVALSRIGLDLPVILKVPVPDTVEKGLSFAFLLLAAALGVGILRDLSVGWFRVRRLKVSGLFWDVFQVLFFAILALVLLKRMFNLNVTPLLATSAILTMVVGLAVQDTLGNLIAGIVFHFEDSIRPGEWVEVDGQIGEVTGLSWRAIVLTTPNQEQLVIPNHDFTRKRFANLSRSGAARAHSIGLGYDDDPDHVVSVLLRALRSTPGIRPQPEPVAHILAFGPHTVEYRLKYWLEDYRTVNATMGAMYRNIWYFLKAHRISVPFPTRTLHLEQAPVTPEPDRDRILAVLREHALFQGFAPSELVALLDYADLQEFPSGAVLAMEGEVGRSLGILLRGAVEVRKADLVLARLEAGEVFGEMSLFTGDPVRASVVAATALSLVAIRREGFEQILRGNPAFLGTIEGLVTRRLADLQARTGEGEVGEAKEDLLSRIRAYLLGV